MVDPLDTTPDTPVSAHEQGVQSAQEAFPGSVIGAGLAGLLYYGSSWTSHPMDAGTAAGIAGALVAVGAMLSSYIQARRRG